MDRIFSAEQIVIPPELPAMLKAYTKEVIHNQPSNIIQFSANYFAKLANISMGGDYFPEHPDKISQDQLVALKNEFVAMDVSRSGVLSKIQIVKACKRIGVLPCVAQDIFGLSFSANDREINWSEFLVLAFTMTAQDVFSAVELIFIVFSTSGSSEGELPASLFLELISHLARRDRELGDMFIAKVRAEFVEGRDGQNLTLNDFFESDLAGELR